jgi:hypothetical protein
MFGVTFLGVLTLVVEPPETAARSPAPAKVGLGKVLV